MPRMWVNTTAFTFVGTAPALPRQILCAPVARFQTVPYKLAKPFALRLHSVDESWLACNVQQLY